MNKKSNISSRVKDEIISLYQSGESIENLSERYELSRQDIKQIVRGVKLDPEAKKRQREMSISFNYGLIKGREESAAFCQETIAEAERVKKETVSLLGPFVIDQLVDFVNSVKSGEKEVKLRDLDLLFQMIDKAAKLDPTLIGIIERAQDRQQAAQKFKAQQNNKSVFSGPMVIRDSEEDEDSEE